MKQYNQGLLQGVCRIKSSFICTKICTKILPVIAHIICSKTGNLIQAVEQAARGSSVLHRKPSSTTKCTRMTSKRIGSERLCPALNILDFFFFKKKVFSCKSLIYFIHVCLRLIHPECLIIFGKNGARLSSVNGELPFPRHLSR